MKKIFLIIGCFVIFGLGSGCAPAPIISDFHSITSDGKDLWVVFNTRKGANNTSMQTLWKCTPMESEGKETVFCNYVEVKGIEEIHDLSPSRSHGVDSGESWNDKRKRKQKN